MNAFLIRLYTRATSPNDERGQATAEYALVLLGAAMVAVLLITWATAGGGAGKIGQLLDRVVDSILSRVP
jgi:Flp pilus assembly pilin Flp